MVLDATRMPAIPAEIAALRAAAMDLQHFFFRLAVEKNTQHQGIGAGLRLARAIDIEIAQHQGRKIEALVEQKRVLLADPFGDAIDIQKIGRIAFAMRRGAVAVIGGGAAIDEALHTSVPRRQQHVLGADDIAGGAKLDLFLRWAGAGHGS